MSFLARFENKISTVTMHGTLRRADGTEEVRSGPLRKKPQPTPLIHDNNRDNNHDFRQEELTPKREPVVVHESPRKPPHVSPQKTKPVKASTIDSPPVNRNELKAATEGDQLAFSKKARPVHYEPCTLTEYRQEKQDKYYELGKLKPDLNATELVEKRANQERIKQFSKNLRQINQTLPKKQKETVVEKEKAPSNREKALAFAKKKVPKPKVVTRKAVSPTKENARTSKRDQPEEPRDQELEVQSELHQLQLKHRAARAQLEALMRE
ncbi:unnamed protein product [Aphanomyces euteiches]